MDNRLPGYGRDRYRYNEWGELTERRDQQLEWNAQGQLTRVISSNSDTLYQYDALGRRISKVTYGRHHGARREPENLVLPHGPDGHGTRGNRAGRDAGVGGLPGGIW
ncbi:hypothetical protein Q7P18_14660 [Shigella flexneri]|nr:MULTISPECIES: hypothetical protein [Shigella]MCW3759476.1 hypothetical protein [Shigella flexneri]MDO8229796.1 hypothetical protein [Shigella flexneri]MDO8244581.1 hypothetical protein [Shigella flexneri]